MDYLGLLLKGGLEKCVGCIRPSMVLNNLPAFDLVNSVK